MSKQKKAPRSWPAYGGFPPLRDRRAGGKDSLRSVFRLFRPSLAPFRQRRKGINQSFVICPWASILPFAPIRTISRPRTDLRVIATCVGTLCVNGAAAAFLIEEDAVVVGQPCQGKDFAFEIEVVDKPLLAQLFGDLLGRIFRFESIDQIHAYQIAYRDFHRQAATDRQTIVAQTFAILDPRRRHVDMASLSCLMSHELNFGNGMETVTAG
jgi:hypothetical protein